MPLAEEKLYFDDGRIIACTEIAAKYFGVSASTLSNWMKAGCPRYKYGFWDIRAVTGWRAQQEERKLAEAAGRDPDSLTPNQQKILAEAQLKQAQLEAATLRNGIARGDYLPKAQVVEELSQFFQVFQQSAYGLGWELVGAVQAHLTPAEARRLENLVQQRLRGALEQFAVSGVYRAQG